MAFGLSSFMLHLVGCCMVTILLDRELAFYCMLRTTDS